MIMVSKLTSLIALSCAAIARAHCVHPGSGNPWNFHLYKGPNCHEIKGEVSVQRFDATHFTRAVQDCWDVTKDFSPIMSATYYGSYSMAGYPSMSASAFVFDRVHAVS
ncbi:hypothetical protein BJ138DRAFT_1153718 [Hygrophoropsis aurantiaca]|uniref:Uncharacterized protein n=1 Tax=Hygrophoropsis aurantiaca TaxID=72124 RepID=A0ACB8AA77_9AGAM|nr:hypothetical protein BJ138DRAFT_1153718 [Hygrophoropsis aurantiaca]